MNEGPTVNGAPMVVVWDEDRQEHEEHAPGEGRLRELVGGLDGRCRTLVTLYRGDVHLAVGGDAGRGLVAYVATNDGRFRQLGTGAPSTDPVEVVAGGQPGRYPGHLVVGPDLALRALATFIASGGPDRDLHWHTT